MPLAWHGKDNRQVLGAWGKTSYSSYGYYSSYNIFASPGPVQICTIFSGGRDLDFTYTILPAGLGDLEGDGERSEGTCVGGHCRTIWICVDSKNFGMAVHLTGAQIGSR